MLTEETNAIIAIRVTEPTIGSQLRKSDLSKRATVAAPRRINVRDRAFAVGLLGGNCSGMRVISHMASAQQEEARGATVPRQDFQAA